MTITPDDYGLSVRVELPRGWIAGRIMEVRGSMLDLLIYAGNAEKVGRIVTVHLSKVEAKS